MKRFLIYFLIGLGLVACDSIAEIEPKDYLPLIQNEEALFEVQETVYQIQQPVIRRSYFLKERISDKVESPGGDFKCNLETYSKDSKDKNWNLISVIPIKKQGVEYIFYVKNIEQVLMVQPLSVNSLWNVNAYNTGKPEKIKEVNLGVKLEKLNPAWVDLAKITFKADSSLLEKNEDIRYYKNQIGLVYSQSKNLVYCQDTPDCIGKKQITYGFEIIKKRILALP